MNNGRTLLKTGCSNIVLFKKRCNILQDKFLIMTAFWEAGSD